MSKSLVLLKELKTEQNHDEFRILPANATRTGKNIFLKKKYAFGDAPEDIKSWLHNLNSLTVSNKYNNYVSIDQFELGTIVNKIFPKCREKHMNEYIVLRGIKKTMDYHYTGAEVIKVVLQHKPTGKLLFLTGLNAIPNETYEPAIAEGWYVFKAKMVAPVGFWDLVRDCI
jgi:hypothetical protein